MSNARSPRMDSSTTRGVSPMMPPHAKIQPASCTTAYDRCRPRATGEFQMPRRAEERVMRHIRREIELEAPIDEVWAAVTRPERLSAWFGAQALEAVLPPGGRITFERQGEIWRG